MSSEVATDRWMNGSEMFMRAPYRSAELYSISIWQNGRVPRKSPDRGRGEAQPQRLDCNRTAGISPTLFLLVTRCGWSFGHSRGPLVAAVPRYAVSPICNRQRVEKTGSAAICRGPQNAILRYSRVQLCA